MLGYQRIPSMPALTLPTKTDSGEIKSPALGSGDFKRLLISGAEKAAVMAVMDKAIERGSAFDRYGGTEVDAYEKEFAAHVGTNFATAVSSGTAAVHTAVAALNLEPGTEVICPPITDPGGIGPVLACLCIPVFADADSESFNSTAESIERQITDQTGAILVAHIAGEPCNMDAIMEVAKRHQLPVVEDAAQAHDATWDGRRLGSIGTLGTFSMMSGKHHTSGGQGGMITTDDEGLYWRAKSFADRGKSYGRSDVGGHFGLNYRMTELEAAIGRVQLKKLPAIVARRQALAARLGERLEGSKLFAIGQIPDKAKSAYWFLRIRVNLDCTALSKVEIAEQLRDLGLPAAPTYTSLMIHQPWFAQKQIFGSSDLPWTLPQVKRIPEYKNCCPGAEAAMNNHLMIALNESVSDDLIERMADALVEVERAVLP